jgi:hypothetical protein
MRKKICMAGEQVICMVLTFSMLGCSMYWDNTPNAIIGEKRLIPEVARVIDEQWEVVSEQLAEELDQDCASRGSISWRNLESEEIVRLSLEEEHGYQYAALCHQIAYGNSAQEVLACAEQLIDAESFDHLSEQVQSIERSMQDDAIAYSRTLPPNQRAPFLRDLQKLVTKTIVLLVAGITYACIPKIIFWGKVTAAAAVSVAAGIVATSILSIYRYYKYGQDSMAGSFQEWVTDVTTDPVAAYALASSMMTVGKTMTKGPVVTGLIIAVFAIYQVIDMVKPMLKKYNFNA